MATFSLRLPDPVQDVTQGAQFIFWGSCVSETESKIDDGILKQVVDQRGSSLSGSPRVYRKSPEPQWKVFKAAFQHVYQKSLLWRELVRWIAVIAIGILAVGATLYVKRHLTHRYEQMRSGTLYFYKATDSNRDVPIKKYAKLDFYVESTLASLCVCVVYAIPASLLRLKAQDSFLSIYCRLNQINQDPYYIIQGINGVDQ